MAIGFGIRRSRLGVICEGKAVLLLLRGQLHARLDVGVVFLGDSLEGRGVRVALARACRARLDVALEDRGLVRGARGRFTCRAEVCWVHAEARRTGRRGREAIGLAGILILGLDDRCRAGAQEEERGEEDGEGGGGDSHFVLMSRKSDGGLWGPPSPRSRRFGVFFDD